MVLAAVVATARCSGCGRNWIHCRFVVNGWSSVGCGWWWMVAAVSGWSLVVGWLEGDGWWQVVCGWWLFVGGCCLAIGGWRLMAVGCCLLVGLVCGCGGSGADTDGGCNDECVGSGACDARVSAGDCDIGANGGRGGKAVAVWRWCCWSLPLCDCCS